MKTTTSQACSTTMVTVAAAAAAAALFVSATTTTVMAATSSTTCTEDDFRASGFELTDTADNTSHTGNYTGCYTIAGTNDDDEELYAYSLTGNLSTGGATFYASDNGGGLEEPIWYFADAEAGSSISDLSSSFFCYDLDENPASDTHPSEVVNWGIILDSAPSSTTSTTCDISTTCGCSVDDDDEEEEEEEEEEDDDAEVDESNAAFSVRALGSHRSVALASGGMLATMVFVASRL